MTKKLYTQFNDIPVRISVELVGVASANYLDEMKLGEKHIDKADRTLRLAIENCVKCLNKKSEFRNDLP